MAGGKGKRVYRVAGNARRVIVPVLAFLLIVGFWIALKSTAAHDYAWPWLPGIVGLILIWWWSERTGVGSRITRALSERAVKSDAIWVVVSRILLAARRARAAVARVLCTAPFRLLARLALPLGILLMVAMAYRLAAIPALLARSGGDSDADMALLVFDWVLFGLGYGLVGLAAPLAALLLLIRRRRSSLGIAMVVQFFGLFGVSVASLRSMLGAFMGGSGSEWTIARMTHPLFETPQTADYAIGLLVCEFLASAAALYLLGRPRVRRHYDERAEPAGSPAD